ncbi:esterase-like activity of phytase family protein [Polyangium sorediatum]|uniref:Esterase-like activity of phytase family protein n=1 Tax=Polyangium sorediatum TaxID=889274 RepID=A0ABT6P0X4_9BACT|nr:esterase-like activity of phytase family protein [Polyangium sorediatum]MDI1433910.1 esterase-like activity of phytase family protein [Polyangium sorediatum]
MRPRFSCPLFAALLLPLACQPSRSSPVPAGDGGTPRQILVTGTDVVGLSSLAVGPSGALFTMTERQPLLLELSPDGAVVRKTAVSGVPEGLDFESLAWLSGESFAIGTEGGCSKTGADRILLATREGDAARVTRTLDVPLSAWGASCDEGHGLEGLCAASGQIVAAIEDVMNGEGKARHAPIERIDPATGDRAAFRLSLTSTKDEKGKISGLDCRARGDDRIEVLAIERHFAVSRILAFTLPAKGPGTAAPIEPRVLVDLAPYSNDGKRNFEGIVWKDETHALLIVDNQYGEKVSGPNELLEVTLPGSP